LNRGTDTDQNKAVSWCIILRVCTNRKQERKERGTQQYRGRGVVPTSEQLGVLEEKGKSGRGNI